MPTTYDNLVTVRLSEDEMETLEKFSEMWNRSRSQIIRDGIQQFQVLESKVDGETVDAVDLLDKFYNEVSDNDA